MELTKEQSERYSRHIKLKEFGVEGQKKLLSSKVLVIGTGGLGSPALMYLAAAGIGTIGIADDDVVDYSNLQRQVIHYTSDVGIPKTESARRKINELNPDVKVIVHNTFITKDNIQVIWKYIKNKGTTIAKIFYAYYHLDMKINEIAFEMQLNESAVKNYIYRTIKELKQFLKEEH